MGKYSRSHQETTKAHHVLQPPIRLSYSGLRTELCTTHELCGSCSELRCTRSVLCSTCADLCGSRPELRCTCSVLRSTSPDHCSSCPDGGPGGSCPDCSAAGASAGDAAGPSADHCAAGTSADGPAGSCPDHCGTSVLCSTASQLRSTCHELR